MVENTESKGRNRSPSYPAIDLEQALDKARVLYLKEGKGSIPVSVAATDWGYKPTSSAGPLAVAALKKFGLLDDEGNSAARKVTLTRSALNLLLAPDQNSREYYNALAEVALTPAIHRETWEKYGGQLPSDGNLRFGLVMERDFTEAGASQFIMEFRKTIAFARLTEDNRDQTQDLEPQEQDIPMSRPTVIQAPPGSVPQFKRGVSVPVEDSIQLPIAQGQWATLSAPFPLTKDAWKRMVLILNVMKPSLIVDGEDDTDDQTDVELEP